MAGQIASDTGQFIMSSTSAALEQNPSGGEKIRVPLDRVQWVHRLSEVDQVLKASSLPTLSRGIRIDKAFDILRRMCEGEHVLESLVPFEEEYVRLHRAIEAAKAQDSTNSRTVSSSTAGEQAIGYLVLEKLEDSLASLDVEDTSPKDWGTRAGAEAALTGKTKRRLPPSGLPRMIQPIGQQTHRLDKKNLDLLDEENLSRSSNHAIASRIITPYSRIQRYGPSSASGNSLAHTAHVETPVQHPEATFNLIPPSEPQAMSSPLPSYRVPSPHPTLQIPREPQTELRPGKVTGRLRAISGPAPRQNRTAMLRAKNAKEEQIYIDLGRKRGRTEPSTSKSKEGNNANLDSKTAVRNATGFEDEEPVLDGPKDGNNANLDSKAAVRKATGFEDEDPFLDGPGERSPIPPRFAKALTAKNDIPVLNNPKTRQPKPPVPALPQSFNKVPTASSLTSTPGKYPIGFKTDEENAHLLQRLMAGDTGKTFGTLNSTASFGVAQTAQVINGVQRADGALPVAIDRLLTLGKRPPKPRPLSFAGSPANPTALPHRRRISADYKNSRLAHKDQQKRNSLLPVEEVADTSDKIIEAAVEHPSTAEISFTEKERAALNQTQQQQNFRLQNWAGALDQVTDSQMNSIKGKGVVAPDNAADHPGDRGQQKMQKPVGFESKLKRASYPRGAARSTAKQNTPTYPNPTTSAIRQRLTNGATSAMANKGSGHVRAGARAAKRTATPVGAPRVSPRSRQPNNLPIAKPAVLGNKSINIKSPAQQTPPVKKSANVSGRELPSVFSGLNRKENRDAKGKLSTASPNILRLNPTPKRSPGSAIPKQSPGSSIPRLSRKPSADITGIGASRNSRFNVTTGANRKWLGLKKAPKVGPTTPYEKIPVPTAAAGKENVDPSKRQIHVSDEQGTKSTKCLGAFNWFRDNRASCQSEDNRTNIQSRLPGKNFPKFGKSSAAGPATGGKRTARSIPEAFLPWFDITQEQVDTLKNRLSANYPSPENAVGGQYSSKNVSTIDASPARDEKEGNPIRVCMELINSACAEQNPEVRENLFMMSRILVDTVTRSKDAQCASEKARLASQEAKLATAEVFVKLQSVVEILADWKRTGRLLALAK